MEGPGHFVQALQKHDRDWSFLWANWRNTRPAPPNGRRAFDPINIPDEAQAFVDHFSLREVLRDWDLRTRDYAGRAGGDARGFRRPRNAWDGDRYDVARTARPRR